MTFPSQLLTDVHALVATPHQGLETITSPLGYLVFEFKLTTKVHIMHKNIFQPLL